jgi:hypothetical protein
MSDTIELHSEPVVCAVCGLEPMVVLTSDLLPVEVGAAYGSCPYHVDTVIARLQDQLHEAIDNYEGVLVDWWTTLHPPVEVPA